MAASEGDKMSFLLGDDIEHIAPITSGDDPLDGVEIDEESSNRIDALIARLEKDATVN